MSMSMSASIFATIQELRWQPILITVIIVILTSTRCTNIVKSQLQKRKLQSIIRTTCSTDSGKASSANTGSSGNGIQVSSIHVHPIKSLRAVSLTSTRLSNLGLEGDRTLMLVQPSSSTGKYRFLTQRQCPILATINTSIPVTTTDGSDNNNTTKITIHHAESKQGVEVVITPSSLLSNPIRYNAGLWDDTVQVVDLGDEAASFFHFILASCDNAAHADDYNDVRLVAQFPQPERRVDGRYCPPVAMDILGRVPNVSLTDGFPILIASESSLKELNRRLKSKGKSAIDMNRFRANIVVKGDTLSAFEEDEWKAIQIGGEDGPIFHVVKGCPRCKQSCTDQMTGERFEEPLETLKEFRALGKNAEDVYFAQNVVLQPGMGGKEICVGDQVRILTRGAPVWDMDSVQAE